MCGIAGYIFPPTLTTHRELLERAGAAMSHRGPDAGAFWFEDPVYFAHRRLSILDTSSAGNQPMFYANKRYAIVYNGEVYNYRELRAELGGEFQTGTDTEVILAAYAAWGKDCLSRFNGMFAFAIWDKVEQRLLLARDRMGIKPLYYHIKGQTLAFASEVRSLTQFPWVPKRIDKNGLINYLCYQTVYGHDTMLEGIQQLGPGEFMEVDRKGIYTDKFWSLFECATDEAQSLSLPQIHTRIRELLGRAVARRLVSDVPLGAFLSGGIDSSAIVALMAQATDQPVDTFNIAFEEKEYDESHYAGLLSKKYNTRHHKILLKPQDFLDELPNALAAMDHPSGDGINSFVVSKYTRAQGIKVALSGLGGDELFAGYPIFRQLPEIQQRKWLWRLPYPARKLLGQVYTSVKKGRQADKAGAIMRLPGPAMEGIYRIFRTIYAPSLAYDMVGETWKNTVGLILADEAHNLNKLPLLSKISVAEIATYTQSVLLRDTDQMSMAHGLEVRVPFFDHNLVKFVLGVPDKYKQNSYPKQLLVESLGDLIPSEIVHRPKMGFVFPWEQWLRTDLKAFCEKGIKRMGERGVLDAVSLQEVWDDFQAGKGPWLWTHVWLPVVLDDWMERNGITA